MRCIFCSEDRPGSKEHVFPFAIGGSLEIERVCSSCNSVLGERVDKALSDNFLIRTIRARLRLAGNSGAVPELYELLLGVGELADGTGRIHATFNEGAQKIDLFRIPSKVDTVSEDGTVTRRYIMDERDIDKLSRIIIRERELLNLPPLTDEEMATLIQQSRDSVTTIENPKINLNRSFNFAFTKHALLKIVYELAFRWLGESYLDDPLALELRTAIMANNPDATDHLLAVDCIRDRQCDIFRFWAADKTSHLAYLGLVDGGVYIALRIFDVYATLVKVSDDVGRHVKGTFDPAHARFIAVDPVHRRYQETTLLNEISRIVTSRREALTQLLP